MTMMVTELYDAHKSAGADEEKAKGAATALANDDNRLNKVESDFAVLKWLVGA